MVLGKWRGTIMAIFSFFVILLTYSCLISPKEVVVQLKLTAPSSDFIKVKSIKDGTNPLAVFDVDITKVSVIVKKGTTKVFEQDFGSLNNISFKISDAGTYRIEAYAYGNLSGSVRAIFYGIKEQMLNYGTNFVTLEGVFFEGTLKLRIESTQSIADKWTYENCLLVLIKNAAPSNVLTYDLKNEITKSPVTFEKNINVEPGIWRVNLTLKLKNKQDGKEFIYMLPENSYLTVFPSMTESLLISLQELESGVVVNVRVTDFTKPYIEPVRGLVADYLKSSDKVILRWEYPSIDESTKFQVFKKLTNQKGMQLIGETTNTMFETVVGSEFANIEYFAVNVVKGEKESGPKEVTDVLMKISEPAENSILSRTINVKTAVIDFAKRVKKTNLLVDSVTDQSYESFKNEVSLDTCKFIDGEHFVGVSYYDSNGNALAEDRVKVNIRNWQKVYSDGIAYDVVESNDKSGYIVVAYVDTSKIRVLKISREGNILWGKTFDGISIWGRNVIANASGGYIICGGKGGDGCVFKIDEMGTVVWEKSFGGPKTDRFYSVSKTSDGNYILGGYRTNTYSSTDFKDGYLVKINEAGGLIWDRTYGNDTSQGNFSDFEIRAAKELRDRRICVVGNGKRDSWLALVDTNGNLLSSYFFNYSYYSDEYFLDFAEVEDGFIIASYYPYYPYYYVRKFVSDATGISERWGVETRLDSSVGLTSDNRIIFPYYFTSGYYRFGIHKVRNLSTYSPEWSWSSPLNGAVYKVIEDSEQNIVCVGGWNNRILVVKIRGNGSWYY